MNDSKFVIWRQASHGNQQCRFAAIADRRRKLMTVVVVEATGLRAVNVPLSEQRYMRTIEMAPYQVRRAKAQLRRKAKGRGVPKAVKTAVQKVLS